MEKQVALLPDWFQGEVYEKGSVVANPFSGEEFYLNNFELSMYDFIIGCNMLYEIMGSLSDKLILDMRKGISWFGENNPEAFYVLID
jgi:hypothetical protein